MKLSGIGKNSPRDFCDFMDGYCDAFDDFPDGAWQSCCMEGVEAFNDWRKTHIDPHDGWLYWVQHSTPKTKEASHD